MAAKPKLAADLCVLTFGGYMQVLLPADKGLKVAALLRGALMVRHPDSYFRNDGPEYQIEGDLEMEYRSTTASKVCQKPEPKVERALAIGVEPLKPPSPARGIA